MPEARATTDPADLTPAQVFCALGLEQAPPEWERDWQRSLELAAQPGGELLPAGEARAHCQWLGMGEDAALALVEAARALPASPPLLRLGWHCHWLLFAGEGEIDAGKWPQVPAAAGPAAELFYALVFLSGLPRVRAQHARRGIEEAITRDTLSDLELWMREYHQLHGRWGVMVIGWLASHFRCRLYKLGRLQFLPGRFHHPFHAWRRRDNHEVLLLAGAGCRLRADGQFASADQGAHVQAPGNWETSLQEDARTVRGQAVDPVRGCVQPGAVTLEKSRWERILAPDDLVLTVHIAATGSMKPAACADSFARAVEFYPRHFPEIECRAFTCDSWLLDPQLEDALPPKSNIVRFLREWYLHPLEHASDSQTLERIFGFEVKTIDPATAPRDSSLQAAIADHMLGGGRWRNGGAVLFAQDLPWGRQAYRRA